MSPSSSTPTREAHPRCRARLEPRLRPDGDLGYLVDWASKLVGVVARIAGVIHAAENLAVTTIPITGAQMADAIRLGEYFTAHAVAAFDEMGADPAIEGAGRRPRLGEAPALEEFTRREAHRGCRGFRAVTELDPCLELLSSTGTSALRSPKAETSAAATTS